MSEVSVRVAARLQALAQRGVDDVLNVLVAISAPPRLRATVLEEMARIAMKEADRMRSATPSRAEGERG